MYRHFGDGRCKGIDEDDLRIFLDLINAADYGGQ